VMYFFATPYLAPCPPFLCALLPPLIILLFFFQVNPFFFLVLSLLFALCVLGAYLVYSTYLWAVWSVS
jgi:hypothetical protein